MEELAMVERVSAVGPLFNEHRGGGEKAPEFHLPLILSPSSDPADNPYLPHGPDQSPEACHLAWR
jgi:hypothetical protein